MQLSKEERAKRLEDWRRSGKSISAYVRENGLVRWTFTKWLKAERDAKPCFVEVSAQEKVSAVHVQAAEILIETGDIKIHIPLAVGSGVLRTVIESLGAAS